MKNEIDGDEGDFSPLVAPRQYRRRSLPSMGQLTLFVFVCNASHGMWHQYFQPADEGLHEYWSNFAKEHGTCVGGVVLGAWECLTLPLTTEDQHFKTLREKLPKRLQKNICGWCVFRIHEMCMLSDDLFPIHTNGPITVAHLRDFDVHEHAYDGAKGFYQNDLKLPQMISEWQTMHNIPSMVLHPVDISLKFFHIFTLKSGQFLGQYRFHALGVCRDVFVFQVASLDLITSNDFRRKLPSPHNQVRVLQHRCTADCLLIAFSSIWTHQQISSS